LVGGVLAPQHLLRANSLTNLLVTRRYTRMRTKNGAASPTEVTAENMKDGLRYLSKADPHLQGVLKLIGPPPLWAREPGFPTLVHIILEQQVSLASAKAAFDRLNALASPLTPSGFLVLEDAALKAAGFSRQKTAYCRHLARSIVDGELDLEAVHRMTDDAARAELLKLKGVGAWTVDIYLLMALRRPDIWPVGDLALAVALHELKLLPARPRPDELTIIGEAWRPWRAVAARLLWHYYLNGRAKASRMPLNAS
jgi:DNA-3-methyladenine glycosylase II